MFWEKEKEKRIRIKVTGIKRIVKIEENKRFEETGIYYSKEGTWKREQIYNAAYICVGGKIYV